MSDSDAIKELREALIYLLEQTVNADIAYGVELTEGEIEAREISLAILEKTKGNKP